MPYADSKKRSIYKTWHSMIDRCHNQNGQSYKHYGARGISVCDRWRQSFESFASDMGERPAGMSIERKDNNGNYEPDNCCWATVSQQMKNRRQWAFRKTHCLHGHELTAENSYFYKEGARLRRCCKICESVRKHKKYLRQHGPLKEIHAALHYHADLTLAAGSRLC